MSVGGQVVEIIDLPECDRIWINTQERRPHSEECAIYVERTVVSRSISVGDSLWWQGKWAMWTPRTGRFRRNPPFVDKKIRRIGFSGVPHPLAGAQEEP